MSWESFISNIYYKNVPEGQMGQCVEKAGIITKADRQVVGSAGGFTLTSYPFEMPNEDESGTQTVHVDETALLFEAIDNEGVVSSPAGIRISGDKYYLVVHDAERSVMYLKKHEGGACVAWSNNAVIFGSWQGALTTTGAKEIPQSPGMCNGQCEAVAEYLRANNS